MVTRKYAKGKKAKAICDRGGHEVAYKDTVVEPGTNLRVDRKWSDGKWNRVDHPQNFSPKEAGDAQALRDPRPDRTEPQVLLVDDNGDVIVGDDGLPFFSYNSKNILGVEYVEE